VKLNKYLQTGGIIHDLSVALGYQNYWVRFRAGSPIQFSRRQTVHSLFQTFPIIAESLLNEIAQVQLNTSARMIIVEGDYIRDALLSRFP